LLIGEAVKDDTIANAATEFMAGAFCIPILSPYDHSPWFLDKDTCPAKMNLGFRTAGLFQYSSFNGKQITHSNFPSIPEAVKQLKHFMSTLPAEPEIINPFD
jgi:hypothetical protein